MCFFYRGNKESLRIFGELSLKEHHCWVSPGGLPQILRFPGGAEGLFHSRLDEKFLCLGKTVMNRTFMFSVKRICSRRRVCLSPGGGGMSPFSISTARGVSWLRGRAGGGWLEKPRELGAKSSNSRNPNHSIPAQFFLDHAFWRMKTVGAVICISE